MTKVSRFNSHESKTGCELGCWHIIWFQELGAIVPPSPITSGAEHMGTVLSESLLTTGDALDKYQHLAQKVVRCFGLMLLLDTDCFTYILFFMYKLLLGSFTCYLDFVLETYSPLLFWWIRYLFTEVSSTQHTCVTQLDELQLAILLYIHYLNNRWSKWMFALWETDLNIETIKYLWILNNNNDSTLSFCLYLQCIFINCQIFLLAGNADSSYESYH